MSPWRFIHITDTHVGSPRSFRYQPAWEDNWETAITQMKSMKPDLLLHGGDITRDGFYHDFEFTERRADIDKYGISWHIVPGNMDIGNKPTNKNGATDSSDRMSDRELSVTRDRLHRFINHFGRVLWTFTHKNVRFTGFCAFLAGSGFPEEREMWDFLENLSTLPRADYHVVMTHFPLFLNDPREPAPDMTADPRSYRAWYFSIDREPRLRMLGMLKQSEATLFLSGHVHCRRVIQNEYGTFYQGPATSFSQYEDEWPDGDPTLGFQSFEVTGSGIEYQFIPLEKVSTRPGYGPGGHPVESRRDYSIAWEPGEG